ncbi:alanine/glycine:cation symporter family protein [Thermococcus celer]|uniref:Alanine glycine permease n=1 Tax=Thermococcus celer Vu 13 = JCM 8558 TaxID=1293037 RepID=A0A218P311_THECE|nr:sodium:alanine symporter family protein [Thermococcus celer]ASI99314.1 alanine glycine permease [Thermococcus celer Vu 13 = JCM 8558]
MSMLVDFINWLDGEVWGLPMIVLLVGTGLFLTTVLKGIQFRRLGWSIRFTLFEGRKKTGEGDISPFQALMATISGTVGIGNIAGVATAIHYGGPGALFWMWVTALVGMATRYSEGLLGVAFRDKLPDGTMIGGTFNFLEKGFAMENVPKTGKYLASIFTLLFAVFIGYSAMSFSGALQIGAIIVAVLFAVLGLFLLKDDAYPTLGKVLAILFATFASIAAFGIGNMTQSNSVADAVRTAFNIPMWVSGLTLAILTFIVIIGGIKRIGEVAEMLVPFMAIIYFLFAIGVWIKFAGKLPSAFALIFKDAFTGKAVAGGAIGQVIIWGVKRGLFSNEAGLGTATLAHAAAKTDHPARQAHVAMLGPFIDTLIICTLTGVSIVVTEAYSLHPELNGAPLTQAAFASAFGHAGEIMVAIGIVLFAYSTILAWSFYGRQNVMYLAKWLEQDPERFARLYPRLHLIYNLLFVFFIYIGSVTKLETVWTFSDMMNGLMAIPNLIGLLVLFWFIREKTEEFVAANP